MAGYTITYGELKAQVVNTIKANVVNIDQLAVPNSLKSGYTNTIASGTGNGCRLESTGIDLPQQYSTSQLTTDFENFCST